MNNCTYIVRKITIVHQVCLNLFQRAALSNNKPQIDVTLQEEVNCLVLFPSLKSKVILHGE